MRKPHIESRGRADGSTSYRLKWWQRDTCGHIHSHSITFNDPDNAAALADAITEHGTLETALDHITWPNPKDTTP